MAGLQFEQLPMSPEQDMEREIQQGRQSIQDKYALQWKTVNRNAKFIAKDKLNAMLQQIDSNAKQEMLQFNQQAEQQMNRLKTVDRIAATGGMEPDKQAELKAGMAYGRDVAGAMYPAEAKERSIPQQFGELDLYGKRISEELGQFKPPEKLSKLAIGVGRVSPLGAAIMALRRKRHALRVWNPDTGKFEKAEPEDIARYVALVREEKDIKQRKSELLGHPSIGSRAKQPGEQGGTFGDKVAESYKKKAPSAAELRKRGTREAYNEGVSLRYWE